MHLDFFPCNAFLFPHRTCIVKTGRVEDLQAETRTFYQQENLPKEGGLPTGYYSHP